MKKGLLFVLIVLLVGMAALSGCGRQAAVPDGNSNGDEAPQQINLQFATFWPEVDFQVAEGHKAWAQEISDRVAAETPHTVTFNWLAGGVLLGPNEIYEGVAAGSADLGSTAPVYTMGMFPLTMGLELPGYNNDNALVASLTMQEAWKRSPELQKEYEDVKVMFFWATGPGGFITTNKPVRSVEDIAGLQIRAAGGSTLAIEALGGTPVPMPMSESYVALDSGIVDGILGPDDILEGFRLAEVTKYITKTPFVGYNVVFVKAMNWDTWNSLPLSVQQIIEEVNEDYVAEYGKLRTDYTQAGQKFAVEGYGHEIIELSDAERSRWLDRILHIPEQWADAREAENLPGRQTLELFLELDAHFSGLYGSYGE